MRCTIFTRLIGNGRKPAAKFVDQLIIKDICVRSLVNHAQFVGNQLGGSRSVKHPLKDLRGVGALCFVLG